VFIFSLNTFTVAELPHWSHQLRGLAPITEEQPPLKWRKVGDLDFEESGLIFGLMKLV
jgi:hypothetical protein